MRSCLLRPHEYIKPDSVWRLYANRQPTKWVECHSQYAQRVHKFTPSPAAFFLLCDAPVVRMKQVKIFLKIVLSVDTLRCEKLRVFRPLSTHRQEHRTSAAPLHQKRRGARSTRSTCSFALQVAVARALGTSEESSAQKPSSCTIQHKHGPAMGIRRCTTVQNRRGSCAKPLTRA